MLLVLDPDTLTDHDLAGEATWAGKYRESDRDTTKIRYQETRRCHFADIELAEPRLDTAHFGHPPVPAGVLASKGPPQACVADKIEQLVAELGSPATGASEQLLSLKYLLHFVGDLLQPLHAADDHDPGGNKKLVTADRLHSGNLHGFWDIEFVEMPRIDPRQVAADRTDFGNATAAVVTRQPADWAIEGFALARNDAYGLLPPPGDCDTHSLSLAYLE